MIEFTIEPGDIKRIELDFARYLEYLWYPGKAYAVNDYVVASVKKSLMHRCTAAGVSDNPEPDWASAVGGVTADGDGSLAWVAEDYASDVYDPLSSATVADVDNITITDVTTAGTVLTMLVTAGSAVGYSTLEAVINTAAGERKTIDILAKVED